METPSFCHSHPLVTASVKVVTLEDRWETTYVNVVLSDVTVELNSLVA